MERLGGVGSHISPFVQPQDVGGLLSKAGFDMITLDLDEIEVTVSFTFKTNDFRSAFRICLPCCMIYN